MIHATFERTMVRRWVMWLASVAISTGVAACSAVVPKLPSQGGPAWVELSSEHFTLWTDAPVARGRQLVRDMELRRQVIMTAMNHAPSPARAFVIVFASSRELKAFAPSHSMAFAIPPTASIYQPAIALAADSTEGGVVVSHEIAHMISYEIIPHQPPWLAEAIAVYFEAVSLEQDPHSVVIGVPYSDHRVTPNAVPYSAARLFACPNSSCLDNWGYASSWLVFSYLLNERFDQLSRYLQYLKDHPSAEAAHAAAWQAAFPELSPDALDTAVRAWSRTGTIRYPRIEVTTENYSATARPLGDADVLALRATLTLIIKHDFGAARALAEAALVADPTQLLAQLTLFSMTGKIPVAVARATLLAHVKDWRAWMLAASASDPPEPHAFARMCAMTTYAPARELCARGPGASATR